MQMMKKFVAVMLVVVLMMGVLPTARVFAVVSGVISVYDDGIGDAETWGDVDGDGVLSLRDYELLGGYLRAACREAFMFVHPYFNRANAKVSGGDEISAADLTLLRLRLGENPSEGAPLQLVTVRPVNGGGNPVFPATLSLDINGVEDCS